MWISVGSLGLPFVGALAALLVTRWVAERNNKTFPAVYLHKLSWFLGVVPVEWAILRTKSYLPSILGGTPDGDEELFAKNADDELDIFYQIQLAYHVHSMVFAYITGAKREMHIHHIVTVALITLSDFARYRRVGLVVLLLHDVPDIVTYCIKAALLAKSTPLVVFFYAVLLPTWGYFRLFLFLKLVIYVAVSSPLSQSDRVVFTTLLGVLVLLHYYWYGQFIQIALSFSKKKSIKDTTETDDAYGQDKFYGNAADTPSTSAPKQAHTLSSRSNAQAHRGASEPDLRSPRKSKTGT